MANLFNFKISLFGYKKKEVNERVALLNSSHEKKIKEKDEEISGLINKYKDLESKYNDAISALENSKAEIAAAVSAVTIALSKVSSIKTKLEVSQQRETMLTSQIDALSQKVSAFEEMKLQKDILDSEKEKIAQAWIISTERADALIADAKQKAATIIEDAKISSELEKKVIENKLDNEREKLVDLKREMRSLKDSFVSMLRRYGDEIDSEIEDKFVEDEFVAEEIIEEVIDVDGGIPELPSDFGMSLRPDAEVSNVLSFSDFIEDDESVTIL